MNTKLAALIVAAISLTVIVSAIGLLRRDKLPARLCLFWVLIWFAVGLFTLVPALLDRIIAMVDMHFRLSFLFVAVSVFFMLAILYLSASLSETQRRVRKLAQELSIANYRLDRVEARGEEARSGG